MDGRCAGRSPWTGGSVQTREMPQRRVIVDGMNVIGSRADGWWRDRPGAMRALVELLVAWASADGEALTVVFDGRPFEL